MTPEATLDRMINIVGEAIRPRCNDHTGNVRHFRVNGQPASARQLRLASLAKDDRHVHSSTRPDPSGTR